MQYITNVFVEKEGRKKVFYFKDKNGQMGMVFNGSGTSYNVGFIETVHLPYKYFNKHRGIEKCAVPACKSCKHETLKTKDWKDIKFNDQYLSPVMRKQTIEKAFGVKLTHEDLLDKELVVGFYEYEGSYKQAYDFAYIDLFQFLKKKKDAFLKKYGAAGVDVLKLPVLLASGEDIEDYIK